MKPKKKSKKSLKKKKLPEKSLHSVSTPSSSKKGKTESKPTEQRLIKKRKLYAKEALQAAYKAVKDSSISVNAAAKQYGVPLTTLRDRVDGRISIDTTRPGPPLLLAKDEEAEIVHFLHTMARYGYRYTRLEMGEIATDQAVEKGKKNPRANGLTTKWVDNFISRWPSVRELSCKFKNKADAEHTVRTYFDEIKNIIDKHRLLDKTDRIFNIMEIGLVTEHGNLGHPTGKSGHTADTVSHTTMIACGSVSGRVMAPFFIFQAVRLRPEMMRGLPSNVNAAVSETGKCTPQIFRRYLNEHFLPQTQRTRDSDPILVLMDGCRSHVFVSLAEWGRSNNVIFSFIPAHTTHLLQPLEVECAEQVQQKYEAICRRYLKNCITPYINRSNIGELACNAYLKVINKHSLVHSFRKAGVYPDISSDESEEEADDKLQEDSYHPSYYKMEDNADDIVTKDDEVFTGDLVVGHNEEVTEEEVVTSQEMVLIDDREDPASSTIVQNSETVDSMLSSHENNEQQQKPQTEEELVVTSEGDVFMSHGGQMMMAPSGHILIQGGEIFVKDSEGSYSRVQPIQLIQTTEDESVTMVEEELAKTDSDLGKISPLKQCVISDGKLLDSAVINVLNDSAFNPVDQSSLVPESLSLISPIPGSQDHNLHSRHYHLSPSDNSSSSSNNSMFASMEESGMNLKPHDSSLELSSSFSVTGESSRGSISPVIHRVIVKQEGLPDKIFKNTK
ncbi:hypothetical protein EGW08_006651 [Elysia chlorotica]|uniref:HTH CENPB-type domain-containing protein n=1 Tax=Elysia chlorotica TaxID=188477 RepID=A0A3S1BK01_ELYCH|nr:hypothetical protein EGW08_006651 [Elysia chlorotica]